MASWFNNITAQIQKEITDAVPSTQDVNGLLQSLTLRSPELAQEQARIEEEEARKESVKDALASLLPWDTRSEEHEILVAEAQEEILALSVDENTFKGPYGNDDLEAETKALQSLEEYPSLLRKFDLDAHVGLVQRLFEEDPNLVEMHSQFSGTGDKEYYFWKNYFFHCAMIRFKIGLSNSEIWDVPTVSSSSKVQQSNLINSMPFFSSVTAPATSQPKISGAGSTSPEEEDEVSITFDSTSVESSSPTSQKSNKNYAAKALSTTTPQPPSTCSPPSSITGVTSDRNAPVSPERDYEIISSKESEANAGGEGGEEGIMDDEDAIDIANEIDLENLGDVDNELDDLEAEIARELED